MPAPRPILIQQQTFWDRVSDDISKMSMANLNHRLQLDIMKKRAQITEKYAKERETRQFERQKILRGMELEAEKAKEKRAHGRAKELLDIRGDQALDIALAKRDLDNKTITLVKSNDPTQTRTMFRTDRRLKGMLEEGWVEKKGAQTKIENIMKMPNELSKQLGKTVGTKIGDKFDAALDLASSIEHINKVKTHLLQDKQLITGSLANYRLAFGKFLKDIVGIDYRENPEDDMIANTEAFIAQMGKEVAEVIKAFGSGTGLSDQDRKYAERLAGGEITMDRRAIEKILWMNEFSKRNVIKNYNTLIGKVMKSMGTDGAQYDFLKIDMPEVVGFGKRTALDVDENGMVQAEIWINPMGETERIPVEEPYNLKESMAAADRNKTGRFRRRRR